MEVKERRLKGLKEVINFSESSYKASLKEYAKKEDLEMIIVAEVKELLGNVKFNAEDLFPHPEKKFYELVEQKFKKENTLKLSGKRLCELKEINTNKLLNNSVFEYGKMINMKKPSVTDFTKYASTREELERLRLCNNLIKGLNDFHKVAPLRWGSIIQAVSGRLKFDHEKQSLVPNEEFVIQKPIR